MENNKLSKRAKRYKAARILGMSRHNAMLAAGFSLKAAAPYASDADIAEFSDELDIQGATHRRLAKLLCEQITANKPVIHDGRITDWYPDNDARRKAAELIAQYKLIPVEKKEVDKVVINNFTCNIPLSKHETQYLENSNPKFLNRIKSIEFVPEKSCA